MTALAARRTTGKIAVPAPRNLRAVEQSAVGRAAARLVNIALEVTFSRLKSVFEAAPDVHSCGSAVARRTRGILRLKDAGNHEPQNERDETGHGVRALLSNESRLSCGALKKDSFPNLRAPPASSAC